MGVDRSLPAGAFFTGLFNDPCSPRNFQEPRTLMRLEWAPGVATELSPRRLLAGDIYLYTAARISITMMLLALGIQINILM